MIEIPIGDFELGIDVFQNHQGEQDAAELGANTYANHICTKYF